MTAILPLSAALPFERPESAVGALDAGLSAQVVAAASDIALVLDRDGVVLDRAVSSSDLAAHGIGDWLNMRWIDTVTSESRHKVSEMLRDAVAGHEPRWREINHPLENGASHPVRYCALDSADDNRIIIIGRDLQSTAALQQRLLNVQQAVERDYLRMRQAESRYRLLFQTASEAILMVDSETRRIREANPAAATLTGLTTTSLVGKELAQLLESDSIVKATQILNAVMVGAASPSADVRLLGGIECRIAASLFRQDGSTTYLVRMTSQKPATAADPARKLTAVLERISDGFVVTDTQLRILTVNPAFLDLTHLANREEAVNQPLDRFLGRPQIDLKVMMAQLRDHGGFRNFSTIVRGPFAEPEDVEVSAVAVPDGDQPCFGFTIRGVGRRVPPPAAAHTATPQSIERLTQLIGRVPMKEVVRESTDLIERLCIEAALTLTSNNRASAADMLGLSRQSLYSKLSRYGLGTPNDPAD